MAIKQLKKLMAIRLEFISFFNGLNLPVEINSRAITNMWRAIIALSLTYGQLEEEVRRVAAALQDADAPGAADQDLVAAVAVEVADALDDVAQAHAFGQGHQRVPLQ